MSSAATLFEGQGKRSARKRRRHMSRLFVITQFKRQQIHLWLLWYLCHLTPAEINGSLTTVVSRIDLSSDKIANGKTVSESEFQW